MTAIFISTDLLETLFLLSWPLHSFGAAIQNGKNLKGLFNFGERRNPAGFDKIFTFIHVFFIGAEGNKERLRRIPYVHPATSIPETIQTLLAKHGPNARWAVVPDGPMVIFKVARKS
jgi:hypothetical protein